MNTVDESLNHLIEAVRNSKEFQDYQIVKAKVEKYPEKKRSLDKYRTRMYKIQNNHGETIYIIILMRSRGNRNDSDRMR